MSLDSIVSITISTESRTPTQAGFGTPLLLAYHTHYLDRVREYADLAEMVTDSFDPDEDIAYKMAAAVFAQSPAPESVKIGRIDTAPTQTVNITPDSTTEGFVYTLRFTFSDGTTEDASYTNGAAETVETVIDGIVAAIGALTGTAFLTTTDNTTDFDVEVATPGDFFFLEATKGERALAIEETTADPGVATDLAEIEAEDPDWYAVVLAHNSKAIATAAAGYVETAEKVLVVTSRDDGVRDSGVSDDVASTLQAADRARTFVVWHHVLSPELGCGILGGWLPTAPGSTTREYKSVSGSAFSYLTTGEKTAIEGKSAGWYERIAGLNVLRNIEVAADEWVDIVRGRDWLSARIQERVFGLLANAPKVPFTDAGVDMVRAEILAQLQEGVNVGLLASDPEPTVTAPLVSSVSAANKANRILPDVTFQATLAGAIHTITVTGRLLV